MAGENALVEVLADQIEADLDEEERQMGLFSEPVTPGGRAAMEHRRGPGRPLGRRNKATIANAEHLLKRHRNPLAVALERIEMHPADLAAMLGCSISDADDKQRLWAVAAMPFLLARLTPEQVVNDHRRAVHLTINTGFPVGTGGGDRGLQLVDPQLVQHHAIEGPVDE